MLEKSEADLWAWFRDGMHKELHDLEKRRHRIQARATSWILAVAALTMLAYVAPVLLHLPRPVFVPLGGLLVLAAFFKDDSVVELVLGGIGLMLWSIWPQQPMDEFFRLTLPFLYRVLPEGTLYPAVAVALVGVFDIHHRMRDFTSDFKSRVIRALAQFIDPNWTPPVNTPPFREYDSLLRTIDVGILPGVSLRLARHSQQLLVHDELRLTFAQHFRQRGEPPAIGVRFPSS